MIGRALLFALAVITSAAEADELGVTVAPPYSVVTADGVFTFGAACNGTDCPAAHYHLVSGTKTLPGISGICFRAIQGSAIYAMDGYGVWSQWNATTKAFAPVSPLSPDCAPLPYSRDGTILSTFGSGSLVTAAGTWSLSTSACAGSQVILLNGSQAAGGCGKILLVHQDGQVFTADVNGNWWKWNGSGWTNLGTTTQP
jgi:hypothetical protein